MAYLKHLSCLASVAALALAGSTLPAQAENNNLQPEVSPEVLVEVSAPEVAPVELQTPENADLEAAEPITSAEFLVEEPSSFSSVFRIQDGNQLAFEEAGIESALSNTQSEAAPNLSEGVELAQSRGAYGGVSPAYLGVGGNFGIGDPDSAVGDFAVVVISKISLGPRFALRPNFFISERFTNFTFPLTYNFNTARLGGFRFQPYLGAGVDVPFNGNTALLLNAGADVPISRDFTLNTAANFRVTSGFGLGLTVGVGYNFPFIFE